MWTALLLTALFCLAQGEISTDSTSAEVDAKRAQSCFFVANPTPAQAFPRTCSSDPDGAQCLQGPGQTGNAGTCGCNNDADCYVNTAFPFCNNATRTCSPCYRATGTTGNTVIEATDHYYCRRRYPSIYIIANEIGPDVNQNGEFVAPSQFYREVCFASDGSCARCDQAQQGSVPGVTFPFSVSSFPSSQAPQASADAANGVIFCNFIRGTGTQRPGRPICASAQYWADTGLEPLVQRTALYVTMDVGHYGDLGPCAPSPFTGNSGCSNLPLPQPAPFFQTDVNLYQPLENWEGACVPCVLELNQTAAGTGTQVNVRTAYHGLCSRVFGTSPICDITSANCRRCQSNAECQAGGASTCLTSTPGQCTGGNNCQADGSCRTCRSDADCGVLDGPFGGPTNNQAICDVASGLCIDRPSCNSNFGEGGTNPCTAALPNCNADGNCVRCATNGNCGATDGPNTLNAGFAGTPNQPVCNTATGICFACQVNADCGTGLNCQSDGTCRDCTTSPATLCTATADGGQPATGPAQCAGTTTTGVFCADKNGQTLCNPATRRCEDPCLGNSWCQGRSSIVSVGGGANCQLSGFCQDCGTPSQNSPNCGAVDGPNTALVGATGTPGQTECGPSQTCVTPFSCTANSQCGAANGQPGNNCQASGACVSCSVGYPTATSQQSTCGTTTGTSTGAAVDGGETPRQPNCNQATRLCVDACSTNAGCVGTQGANCMSNGLCLDCRSDADCASTTLWGGDGGETPQQTRCDLTSRLCVTPFFCAANADCTAANGQNQANCQIDGTCRDCVVTYTSSTCSSADGPQNPRTSADRPNQPNCQQTSRQCVDACTTNAGCVGTQGANCMANGLCLDCRNNADCQPSGNPWGGDGGEQPGQPICVNRICTPACTTNFGGAQTGANGQIVACPSTAPNCNDDGTCVACTSDAGCAATDGPPQTQRKNIKCGTDGVCIDPFSCGTTPLTTVDNAGCQANFQDNAHQNCQADGTCVTCTTNALCYATDGGLIPKQPRCDSITGTCVGCLSNADCPAEAANCGSDGLCYDCRLPGNACGAGPDGPPGTTRPNPNCDPQTGICVDFCTADDDCLDPCLPRCQIDRGCCVECNTNNDCPVAQWRGTERATRTHCDTQNGFICTNAAASAPVCETDANCTGIFKACSFTEQRCVECLYDSHCGGATPACATHIQKCVQCVQSIHCAGITDDVRGLRTSAFCDATNHVCVVNSSSALTASVLLFLALVASLVF